MTAQPSLWQAQQTNIKRVGGRIGPTVLEFCADHLGQQFYMRELESFVSTRVPGAPDSPSRILRDLRQSNHIDYVVVSRSQSLYRLTRVTLPASATRSVVALEQAGRKGVVG